jgi:hypothetical protein
MQLTVGRSGLKPNAEGIILIGRSGKMIED